VSGLIGIGIVLGIGFIIMLAVIGLYNSMKGRQIAAEGAWADIDVQLRRRHDLIPNLLETVKGYATHEKQTLERVVAARNAATGAASVGEKVAAENMLSQALGRLFALKEAYPDLKANQNFLHLQGELAGTENQISGSRQGYNDAARRYNESIAMFPAAVIAGMFGFKPLAYFEVADEVVRQAPVVKF
jgi:LemA protein